MIRSAAYTLSPSSILCIPSLEGVENNFIQNNTAIQRVIQSLHPILWGALQSNTHLKRVHYTFSVRSESIFIQSCRANDPFCGAGRYGLPVRCLCRNWGKGRKAPPARVPRTHRALTPRSADRARYESANARSIFCKQTSFIFIFRLGIFMISPVYHLFFLLFQGLIIAVFRIGLRISLPTYRLSTFNWKLKLFVGNN